MDNRPISELTVSELEELIKSTVKKSVADAMLDFAMEADVEAQIAYEAEVNDMLRKEIGSYGSVPDAERMTVIKVDD